MFNQKLLDWIKIQNARLGRKFPNETKKEGVFAQLGKVAEEVGEFASEVLGSQKNQRTDKLNTINKDSLEGEFADVIITILILADTLDIDMNGALEKKISALNERFKDD